jgi:hypothetical protein
VGDGLWLDKKRIFLNGYGKFERNYHGRRVVAMGSTLYFLRRGGSERLKSKDNGSRNRERGLRRRGGKQVFCLHRATDLCAIVFGLDLDGSGCICSGKGEEGGAIGGGRERGYSPHCGIHRGSDSPSAIISEDVEPHDGLGAVKGLGPEIVLC